MERDENWVHISKHIVEIVDLKFERVFDKFKAIDEALTLREINVHKELDHLNNLRRDYEQKKIQDAQDFVKNGEYNIQHRLVVDNLRDVQNKTLLMEAKHDTKTRNFWIGVAISIALSMISLIKEFLQ